MGIFFAFFRGMKTSPLARLFKEGIEETCVCAVFTGEKNNVI
jgi:hypothetical protein